ncbi:MAG: hypothetical protein JKY09_00565 [Crocinitomicaceae bacterium]|nr:hypothetical protein [Crocinitomicaceae bacterium]
MKEFIYEETNYINHKDLKEFTDLMVKYDFMPEDIQNEDEFNIAFQYLVNLTIKAPDFLQPYEFALSMLSHLEPDEDLRELQTELELRWFEACERIAQKENIFSRQVPWFCMENRPLIRGLYNKADQMWKRGELNDAHELFSKILKINEGDNIGARYSVKATGEKMNYKDFEDKFTYSDEDGSFYKNEELWEWFGES